MSSKSKEKSEGQTTPPPQVKFSFEFYDTVSDEYCLSKFTNDQVKIAMQRLKDVSGKTFNELKAQSKVYHFNPVIWEKTIKPEGFGQPKLEGLEPFHFALLNVNGQKTRVYGAYGTGIFYIVWFDLDHLIWPTPLRNT